MNKKSNIPISRKAKQVILSGKPKAEIQSALSKNKIEFHFTLKHGSWLKMAEMEFSAFSRQCLGRRIASQDVLESESLIWQKNRNLKAK